MNQKQTVKAYWQAFNRHNVDEILSLLAEDVIFYGPSNPQGLKGKKYLRIFWETVFYKAIPNMKEEIKIIYTEGNTVICEVIESGTLSGELQYPGELLPITVTPTNKSYRMRVAAFFTVDEKGLINEIRAYWDLASFMFQTGIEYSQLQFAISKISDAQKQLQ